MNTGSSSTPYSLRSFIGGQSDYEDKGISGSFKNGQSLDIRKRRDSLSCQQAVTDDLAPGTFTDLPLFTVVASDGNTYFFLRDGKIYRRNSIGAYLLVYTDSNESGNIIGAEEWYDSSGYTYLFWATPTRLNLKRIIGTAYSNTEPWNDVNTATSGSWPKTNLTSATWHTMKVCNGELLICNNQYLALVGYDQSYTNNALTLIPGNTAVTLVERGKYGIVGCNKVGNQDESSLFAWDGLSLSWNDKKPIKMAGINSMIDTELSLMQIGDQGQLYISDLNQPLPIKSFSGGGKTYPDGVTSYKGMALFGVFNNSLSKNGIWSFGRINKNAPIVLNYEYPIECDEIGSVFVINDDIFATYKNGTDYGVKKVDTQNKATATYQSLDLIAPISSKNSPGSMGRHTQWTKTVLVCQPIPKNAKIEYWYRIDKVEDPSLNSNADANGWVQSNLEDLSVQATTGQAELTFYIGEKGRVIEDQVILIPAGNNSPEVNEINTYMDA